MLGSGCSVAFACPASTEAQLKVSIEMGAGWCRCTISEIHVFMSRGRCHAVRSTNKTRSRVSILAMVMETEAYAVIQELLRCFMTFPVRLLESKGDGPFIRRIEM